MYTKGLYRKQNVQESTKITALLAKNANQTEMIKVIDTLTGPCVFTRRGINKVSKSK